ASNSSRTGCRRRWRNIIAPRRIRFVIVANANRSNQSSRMRKLRRFQFAEIAGLVIALLFLVGGMIALVDSHELVLFRASNEFVGTPSGIIEGLSPDATRYYAIGALV